MRRNQTAPDVIGGHFRHMLLNFEVSEIKQIKSKLNSYNFGIISTIFFRIELLELVVAIESNVSLHC